jgi:hypothetical protein
MPEKDPETGHSSRLLRGLIWAGVLLAPLAAAIVLLGSSSGSVRFAVLLIAVSVALIGASVLIRNDPVLHRMHVEDRVAEEIETLRRDLRAEFARGAAPQPSGNAGFFQDAPMAAPDDDPFPAAAPRRDRALADGGRTVGDSGFAKRGRAASDSGFASGGRPVGDSGFASGGRAAVRPPTAASVPPPAAVAVAAVRPMPPGPHFDEPASRYDGTSYDGPSYDEPGPVRGEPGITSGARPVVATASPGVPQPRGAAPIPASPAAPRGAASVAAPRGAASASIAGPRGAAPVSVAGPRGAASVPVAAPRGAASVRPTSTGYGPAESLDGDFGASNGYSAVPPPNGYPAPGGTYGSTRLNDGHQEPGDYGYPPATGHPGDGYRDDDGYAPADRYGASNYAPGNAQGGYGAEGGYGPEDGEFDAYPRGEVDPSGYGLDGGYDGQPANGDPAYKARRHRPSANDTNVGTLADFAAYPGWENEPQVDERYVQGYGRR